MDKINHIPHQDASITSTVLSWGGIGGGIMVVWNLILNLSGLASPGGSGGTAMFLGLLLTVIGFGIWIGIHYFAFGSYRDKENGGYLSIGKALLIGFLISVIAALLVAIYSYVNLAFIDPSMIDQILEDTYSTYESMGMSADDIDQSMGLMEMIFKPSIFAILAFLSGIVAGTLGAVAAGFIQRRERPDTV